MARYLGVSEMILEDDDLKAALARVDVDFPDRPHPYPVEGYPHGETMTQFKMTCRFFPGADRHYWRDQNDI